jgi:hypothetical protein
VPRDQEDGGFRAYEMAVRGLNPVVEELRAVKNSPGSASLERRRLAVTGGDRVVVAVSAAPKHRFSKEVRISINILAGHGVEGDAHAGPLVRHRYLARWRPKMSNARQVHLIEVELLEDLERLGFRLGPGDLGENVTTRGIELSCLPWGTRLHLGASAVVELRGLRTPCVLIDRFQSGLLKAVTQKGGIPLFRAGVMAVASESGAVQAGDAIKTVLPEPPHNRLPAI